MADAITIQDSRIDGLAAAAEWMEAGDLQPEHFTNPGADNWGEEGCNVGDAAATAWPTSRYRLRVEGSRAGLAWDDDHWSAYLDGFEDEAKRLAQQRGWSTEVADA